MSNFHLPRVPKQIYFVSVPFCEGTTLCKYNFNAELEKMDVGWALT